MKIERRITPNRRDKQASEELRNNSPVKLATFPSFYLFLFLLFFYVRCFSQTRTTSILLFRASRLKLFSFFPNFIFFLSLLPSSAGFVTPLLCSLRQRAAASCRWSMLFFPANKHRESASSRICVPPFCPRSFRNTPAGNVNTLSTAERFLVSSPLMTTVCEFYGTCALVARLASFMYGSYVPFVTMLRSFNRFQQAKESGSDRLFLIGSIRLKR